MAQNKKSISNGEGILDAVIVGAGAAGLCTIYKLREKGFSIHCIEAGEDVGGTWYWNRYPGARVDFESMEYSFSFSNIVQQEWTWSERYAGQPELQRYFSFVADRLDLRRHIQFGTRVTSAEFDEDQNLWVIGTDSGDRFKARHCVMATGFLSAPNKPPFKGVEKFKGEQFHTAGWPESLVDFSGKRVGVIGTGSSGVQIIPHVAEQARHLTVFQRTPGYCIPARNHPMPDEYQSRVKNDYATWRHKERFESSSGFVAVNYEPTRRLTEMTFDVSPEERLAVYEERWKNGGLAFYNIYPDIYTSREANDTLAEFVRGKLRERIGDSALAEKLIPDYPIMLKRLIAENGYYETFQRNNVSLVDVKQTPIAEIVPEGVKVGETVHELDAIIFATGFDAMTGALLRMDIRGRGGETLREHWAGGAQTFAGIMSAGFPNLFFIDSAGSPGPLFSPILLSEDQSDWITECLCYLRENRITSIAPPKAAEDRWTDLCKEVLDATLFPTVESWYVGANVPGKSQYGLIFFGGIDLYRETLAGAKQEGFGSFLQDAPRSGKNGLGRRPGELAG